ncbi:MaoC/PaaZ C-terminal domain-containing protein [Evansella halocellulosilytica]|uniref:MaoC/PaaZ C-terminal domain-containing protein n=1 Tax=Evansella halocellulosilytica TaxID=2011013 RepID=UPI000BB77247|nr:MaoC/PaaZ C-terminal domain-containing protein [Evansella halocellulosilytica]
MFTKKRKLGRTIDGLEIGEKVEVTKKIEDKDILLYLGYTDDANPIYIQHDYASRTPFQKPIVPHVLMNGFVFSTVSMYLPGPGSAVISQTLSYPKPLYHYGKLDLTVEITEINEEKHIVTLSVVGKDELGDTVLEGSLDVCPPYPMKPMTFDEGNFENF